MDTFRYKTPTVKYSGQPFFEEMKNLNSKEKENINLARKKTYCGSLKHFLHVAAKQYIQDSVKRINADKEKENNEEVKITLLEKHGFKVFHVSSDNTGSGINPIIYPINPDIYFHLGENESELYLKFSNKLKIIYTREHEENVFAKKNRGKKAFPNDRQISWITLPADSVLIDTTGYYFDSFGIQSFGYWAFDRVSNMLPYEYYLPDSMLINYYGE